MDWLTTSEILRHLRTDPRSPSWTMLVGRFQPVIVSVGRQHGLSAQDAEDAAQETFVAFVEGFRAGRYDRDKGRLSHWLKGIARHQVSRRRRRRAREARAAGDLEAVADADQPAVDAALDATFDREWEQNVLAECEAQLRTEVAPKTFEVYQRIWRNETPKTISAALGMSVDAVYIAKSRTLQRMRELRRECEDAEGG